MELDDDVFFAELSKQIALLIAEDEEDVIPLKEFPALYLPVPAQVHAHYPHMMMSPMHAYDGHACRSWESRGTGVFIPKSSSLQRRKVKPLKPSSPVSNCQTKPFTRTAAAASDFNHSTINKSEALKKLNNA